MKRGKNKSWFSAKCFLIAIAVIVFVLALIVVQSPQTKACTAEAKICPDGSAVGRVLPDCKFAPCPSCQCQDGYVLEGDVCNPECYYSTPPCLIPSVQCKATSSQAEELCKISGGTVVTSLCCQSASDFPNTCLIGACGCSPGNSHEIKTCECPEGKCFDGNQCMQQ